MMAPTELRIVRPLDLQREIDLIAQERWAIEEYERTGIPMVGGAAAGAWTFTNEGRTKLLDGTNIPGTGTFKMALFLSTSNLSATSTTYAGVTNEVASAFGYTTGGGSITLSLSGTTTVTVAGTNVSWTASGGSLTARFAAIYTVSGHVLCYCLLDSTPADVTVTTGNILTVQISGSGVFTLA